ncbi:LysR substrate-binding domain-containing protein [Roseibium porphyridii]|uniref:LysR substrate-binding domain-containing protein n=1 Tax=Roseibium porphyridii TaxID=2866279 RepID=A0ABY8F953_9HYPH|nr:LysR substrate-binding domain-containing protein [Roseibium sp. KMA01]WFE91987.1 LysR substrate-binding domain-containing protein [Roseibium sp. KMA01]
MLSVPNLQWLRSFEAASRNGSFTAAGEELGLTQAAISTHIRALEQQLGHQLLIRSTRNVDLTASGKAYLPSVRKALTDLAVSTTGLFGTTAPGSVTIRAPISEAVLIIAPALASFQNEYPEIEIRLLSAIWADTVLETGIDIEIRLGTGNWPGAHAEALGLEVMVPVCHPDLAVNLHSAADLSEYPLIHILGFENHWVRFFEAQGISMPEDRGITVDTSLAAVEWAAAKGGVALLLGRVARQLASSGRLAIPFETTIPALQTHYLLHREGSSMRKPSAQRVETWLRELFQ